MSHLPDDFFSGTISYHERTDRSQLNDRKRLDAIIISLRELYPTAKYSISDGYSYKYLTQNYPIPPGQLGGRSINDLGLLGEFLDKNIKPSLINGYLNNSETYEWLLKFLEDIIEEIRMENKRRTSSPTSSNSVGYGNSKIGIKISQFETYSR